MSAACQNPTCTIRSQSPKHWWQGWQSGNWPEKPLAHWSQRTPDTPCWQTQWPVALWHWEVSIPRQSQSQAEEEKSPEEKRLNKRFRRTSRWKKKKDTKEENKVKLLTSADGPRVSPEVLLTVSAGLAPKAIPTLTLTRELRIKKQKSKETQNTREHLKKWRAWSSRTDVPVHKHLLQLLWEPFQASSVH